MLFHVYITVWAKKAYSGTVPRAHRQLTFHFHYNIPQLTGFHLSMSLFRRMLENEKVAGIKCSSAPAQDILRFKLTGGKDFLIFNGPDEYFIVGRLTGVGAGLGGTYGATIKLY